MITLSPKVIMEVEMQDKIIKLFYDDVYAQFTINELATKTNISYSYVYRQIEELKDKKIIVVDQRSNRKYCRPNYENPEVKTSFVKISNQIAEDFLKKRDKVFFVAEKLLSVLPKKTDFNLLSVVLFGSLAKGTDFKKSDIDLFILIPSKKKYDEIIDMECVALSKGFGVEINPLVSEPTNLLTMLKDKEHNVAKEILKNKVILFGAEKFWELILEVIK
ncbi:HTH domain-containing protein [candidate division NPL-UPA2 bacterium Unc8]|uniref:HTH domain-containing protein n=1 Tax=candidate division NPL-UPA2 bacterium Unc8 TaxID=1980939 RepID=A0A399FXI2_UNCN2|nr:MAG: HTH domain-containing protein [candidate division NPL-UPA2 bacterium Unc8]